MWLIFAKKKKKIFVCTEMQCSRLPFNFLTTEGCRHRVWAAGVACTVHADAVSQRLSLSSCKSENYIASSSGELSPPTCLLCGGLGWSGQMPIQAF